MMRTFFLTFLFITSSLMAAPFVDMGDGTVKDSSTGLLWQKCSYGYTYTSGSCSGSIVYITWQAALNYCKTLTLASLTWRVPSVQEAKSLFSYKLSPVTDSSMFNSATGAFWSSTTTSSTVTNAWYTDASTGEVFATPKSNTQSVRCVSGP